MSSESSTTRLQSTPPRGMHCSKQASPGRRSSRHALPRRDASHRLEERGAAKPAGLPQFLVTRGIDGSELIAACPLYLKDHSYGEYVFDWAWADAYRRRAASQYYPKLLSAVPFTPVPGAEAAGDAMRQRTASCCCVAMQQFARSGCELCRPPTCYFLTKLDQSAAREEGWIDAQHRAVSLDAIARRCALGWTSPISSPACSVTSARRFSRNDAGSTDAGVSLHRIARCRSDPRSADWDFFYRCYTLRLIANTAQRRI